MSFAPRSRRFVVGLIIGLAASGFVTAASAEAGVLVESAGSCESRSLTKPFLPWLDPADYTRLATFEDGAAGWALDGAAVSEGNEPWNVAEDGGTRSLGLAPGSSATSPPICVGVEHPTVRFFAKRAGGGLLGGLSTLRVDVVYDNHIGLLETLPIAIVGATSAWQPTAPLAVLANLLPLLPGERTAVAFRFTAQGSAEWRVDDVFVDPWRGG